MTVYTVYTASTAGMVHHQGLSIAQKLQQMTGQSHQQQAQHNYTVSAHSVATILRPCWQTYMQTSIYLEKEQGHMT